MIFFADSAFRSVYLCKLFHYYGKLDKLNLSLTVSEETHWQLECELAGCVSDKVWIKGCDWGCKYYFSDSAMMEYYRLCHAYSRQFGVSLEQNPFVIEAADRVGEMLDLADSNYGFRLNDKINHKWASGIVFFCDEYFDGYTEMIEALLKVFCFYETQLTVLKKTLSEQQIMKEAA